MVEVEWGVSLTLVIVRYQRMKYPPLYPHHMLLLRAVSGSNWHLCSCPVIDKVYKINRRFVFVMRLLGIGYRGINLFYGLIDLGKGLSSNIYYASQAVYDLSTKAAVTTEKKLIAAKSFPFIYLCRAIGRGKNENLLLFVRRHYFNWKIF